MKNRLVGLLGLLLVMIAACASQKKLANAPDYDSVMMRRTTCFGRCPDYSLEIRKDGIVRYTGYRFTEMTGIYEKNIGTKQAQEIIDEARSYRIDTCSAEYPMLISDLPGLIYTVDMGSTTKTIRHANFGPAFLKDLAKYIDGAVKPDASWKRISDTPGEQ